VMFRDEFGEFKVEDRVRKGPPKRNHIKYAIFRGGSGPTILVGHNFFVGLCFQYFKVNDFVTLTTTSLFSLVLYIYI